MGIGLQARKSNRSAWLHKPASGILREDFAMFDSLDEQMKKDMNKETTPRQRMLMWVVIVLASIVIFGGLYFGVRLIS